MPENWEGTRSYYGQPMIKPPVWTWEIPVYFFTGGMAGSAAGLAYLAELRGNDVLAKRAWTVAMGGIGVSPLLLISDLGKPSRFLNMLRMFKPTSPMSIGSWILSVSGGTTTLAALNAWTGWLPGSARLAKPVAAVFGLPLSTYTAALITNTSVPVWHQARGTLPFVFGAGAAVSAGAAIVMATPPAHAGPARRLAVGAAALEMGSKELMSRRLGADGEPYKHGPAHTFERVARGCLIGGAALMARAGARSRPVAVASGALLCAGALAMRWSTYKAGFGSAQDPRYTVAPQRQRIERGRTPGASRREARVQTPDADRGSPATSVRAQTA